MLPNALVTFLPDIHRMLAQAYWTKNELNLAKEHLVSYFQLVPGKVTREDNYKMCIRDSPMTNQEIVFDSELPDDITKLINLFNNYKSTYNLG